MGWVDKLHGRLIAIDTAPIIYFIEQHATFGPVVEPLFDAIDAAQVRAVTSVLTLCEVLVHPLKNHDEGLARLYNDTLLSSPNIDTLPITATVCQLAA